MAITLAERPKLIAGVMPKQFKFIGKSPVPPTVEGWFLAVNAIYSVCLNLTIDHLEDVKGRAFYDSHLKDGWNIKDQETFFGCITDLYYRGSRRKLEALQAMDPSVPQGDLLGFDLVRFFVLTRGALSLGYIDSAIATNLMIHAARCLQANYGSWRELAESFWRGYQVNRYPLNTTDSATSRANMEEMKDVIELLNASSHSPWKSVAWNTPMPATLPNDLFEEISQRFVSGRLCSMDEGKFEPNERAWMYNVAAIYRVFSSWGVTSPRELFETTCALYLDGHRGETELPDPLAWDLVRIFQIVTSGISVGFVSPDEALPLLRSAGAWLQKTYSSWEELSAAFVRGRIDWRRHQGQSLTEPAIVESDRKFNEAIEILKSDPHSPWKKIPWTTPLVPVPLPPYLQSKPPENEVRAIRGLSGKPSDSEN